MKKRVETSGRREWGGRKGGRVEKSEGGRGLREGGRDGMHAFMECVLNREPERSRVAC